MSLTSVTVICPNARRVPIKVTPSTLLRKVLEEACLSNGFEPLGHELRHLKKALDLALPLRLAGLPNNATLDLVESIVGLTVQDVTIALQLPTARHEVKCKTSDSLLEVVRLVSESMGIDLISANEEGHPSCSYMNRQYRGELELSFRTLGSIGINGGRILIRYVRLHLDAEKLEEIERSINEEKCEKERLERKFENAKKENEARLRREEEEEKQIERLREEEERRQREEMERAAANPPLQMSIPDRLPTGPPMAPSDDGWAFDSPFVAPPPTVPSMTPPTVSSRAPVFRAPAPPPIVSPVRSARIEALEALLHNVNQDLSSRSGSSAIVDTVAEVGRIPVASVNDILSAGRMETEENKEPLPERCERRAVYFKREEQSDKSEEELGDEFFELTVDDIKNIQKGYKEVVRNQTQRALLPRSTLEERNKERKLTAWKHVIIRFRLPNEVVIQGSFLPHEPACHLHEFLSSMMNGSFSLRFINCKIEKGEKKTLVAMDLAPKATIVVSCGEVSINEETARKVSPDEAEDNSREWLSANSSYVPYAPTVSAEPANLAQKRAADMSPTSQRRAIPESLPTGPKWLKKK